MEDGGDVVAKDEKYVGIDGDTEPSQVRELETEEEQREFGSREEGAVENPADTDGLEGDSVADHKLKKGCIH